MKRIVYAIACAAGLLVPTSAAADPRAEVSALGAFGGWTGPFNTGVLFGGAGGAEAVFADRVGIGGDVGLFTNERGGTLLTLSPGGSFRFVTPSASRVVPYVAGGYSYLEFFSLGDHGYNVAGGVDFRLSDRRAVRVEFRDVIRLTHVDDPIHYFAVRVGMAFR